MGVVIGGVAVIMSFVADGMTIRRQVGRLVDSRRYQAGINANDPRIIVACGSARTYQRFAEGSRTNLTYPVIGELCRIFGADGQFVFEMQRLWQLVDKTSWSQSVDALLASGFDPYLEFEQIVVKLDLYQTIYVVGLLQSERYMRSLFARNADLSSDDIEKLVELRLQRQHQIEERGNAVSIRVLMHETALRSGCDSDQLAQLQLADERENFSIKYLPFEGGPYAQLDGPFNLLTFAQDQDPDLVYLDAPDESRFLEGERSVKIFQRSFEAGLLVGRSIREFRQ